MDSQRNNTVRWLLFSVVSIIVFLVLVAVLNLIGFVPEIPEQQVAADEINALQEDISKGSNAETIPSILPTRIVIDAIGVDSIIETPQSRDIEVLDEALVRGVVQYPGSGTLLEDTNMFLFGHSSGLPIVHNPSYRVFNKLSDLEAGNVIRVQGDTVENVYRVLSVRLVDANEALVKLSREEKKLTLSTCNSFGAKSERYVVEADFIGSYQL